MLRFLLALCLLLQALAQNCEDITSQSTCLSKSCAWCTSGAVGNTCLPKADAANLPSSVFTCTSNLSAVNYAGQAHVTSSKNSGKGVMDSSTMYVFAYSWSPGFCGTQPSTDPGCQAPENYWTNHFTIHGLWPQYTTTGYPHDCTSEAFDPSAVAPIGMNNMMEFWPNVQAAPDSSNYDDFWTHEWTKHGTCSGLGQTQYFNTTMNLAHSFPTPAIFTENVGKAVSASDLRNAFGGSTMVSLLCSGGNQLTGAYTCWTQTNGIPEKQTTCPSSVQQEDTCTSATVNVVAFPASSK
jgi:ribonuclease T2